MGAVRFKHSLFVQVELLQSLHNPVLYEFTLKLSVIAVFLCTLFDKTIHELSFHGPQREPEREKKPSVLAHKEKLEAERKGRRSGI